jgi:hypothetical protein
MVERRKKLEIESGEVPVSRALELLIEVNYRQLKHDGLH